MKKMKDEEESLMKNTIQRMEAKELVRKVWVQQQMDQSKKLNNLNKIYKDGSKMMLVGSGTNAKNAN